MLKILIETIRDFLILIKKKKNKNER